MAELRRRFLERFSGKGRLEKMTGDDSDFDPDEGEGKGVIPRCIQKQIEAATRNRRRGV